MSKITWIKLAIDMFDDEKIKIIDSMPERNLIHYVWTRLLIQAGKTNAKGNIFLNENVPYTKEMISIIFNRSVNDIELSLKVLSDLRMIEINENNFVSILNWEKHQNIEGMERIREQTRKRVEKLREKQKLESQIVDIEDEEDTDSAEYKEYIEDGNNFETDEDNVDDSLTIEKNSTIISDINNDRNSKVNLKTPCNVTVTEQTKRENKIKTKKENKTEINKENKTKIKIENMSKIKSNIENKNMDIAKTNRENKNTCDTVCLEALDFDTEESETNISGLSKNKKGVSFIDKKFSTVEKIESKATSEEDIEKYIKKLGVKIIGGSISAMKLAVSIHGIVNVKLAVEKSLEANKPRMNYINGILTNWKREGYPNNISKVGEGSYTNSYNKQKVLSFNNFEPRKYDYNELEKALLGW